MNTCEGFPITASDFLHVKGSLTDSYCCLCALPSLRLPSPEAAPIVKWICIFAFFMLLLPLNVPVGFMTVYFTFEFTTWLFFSQQF